MKQFESEHYVFNYNERSKAACDIAEIAEHQEHCFQHICKVLNVTIDFKIEYFLCNSPEEVGEIYGDNEPCCGFASLPNKIYAVYNEQVQCIGFHEDAHIISYTRNRPNCPAIREGLAMYFDRKWWGISNLDWTVYYLKNGQYLTIDELLESDTFFAADDTKTYPIMGAFTEWLISVYGIETFMQVYCQKDIFTAMEMIYHKTPAELNSDFVSYVRLFRLDSTLEKHIDALLTRRSIT